MQPECPLRPPWAGVDEPDRQSPQETDSRTAMDDSTCEQPKLPGKRWSKADVVVLMEAMANGCDATAKSKEHRSAIAARLNTSEDRIQVWFTNNRRMREALVSSTKDASTTLHSSSHRLNGGETLPETTNEIRLETFRPTATRFMQNRIDRALQPRSRLQLLSRRLIDPCHQEFKVISSKAATYTCSVKQIPECNCGDWEKGRNCKHLLFVFLKVLRVPSTSPLIFQKALLTSEVKEILEFGNKFDPKIRYAKKIHEAGGTQLPTPPIRASLSEAPCPLCYDDFESQPVETGWCDRFAANIAATC
ncbi:hypothetical protein HDU84_003663 [Entophlyctis sp. JEL0112]|nr:hypothetical protein HDU84_003663 [Entophlyctis sp. JEL0112]